MEGIEDDVSERGRNACLPERAKRACVSLFFIFLVGSILIDAMPSVTPRIEKLKLSYGAFLNRMGLWQGSWTLFAPDPAACNVWISAEIYDPEGNVSLWNSPYWAKTSTSERFFSYRYIIYYRRLELVNRVAADDLADYVARNEIAIPLRLSEEQSIVTSDATRDSWRINLSSNKLNLSLGAGEPLPSKDAAVWYANSRNLCIRRYDPE